jgi:hypothetical protein
VALAIVSELGLILRRKEAKKPPNGRSTSVVRVTSHRVLERRQRRPSLIGGDRIQLLGANRDLLEILTRGVERHASLVDLLVRMGYERVTALEVT